MKHTIAASAIFVACTALGACDFSLDASITPKETFVIHPDVDADNVNVGQELRVTLTADNIYLIDPDETPPPEHADNAGHFQIYLDDLDGTPLVITAELDVTVVIPSTIEPGAHKLKCRIHKHDGTATSTVEEVSFTVTVVAGT